MKRLVLPLLAGLALAGCATDDAYVGTSYGHPAWGWNAWDSPYYGGAIGYSTPLYIDGRAAPRVRERDRDRDGIPNRFDRDRDGDGVPNRLDARPNNPRRQ